VEAHREQLRKLPKIDDLVARAQEIGDELPRWALVESARALVEEARARILSGSEADVSPEAVARSAAARLTPSLRQVINGSGVILHTNMGRAPMAVAAIEALEIARGYSNLELNLATGRRGSRHGHPAELISRLSGAEDACVVNNNAGAVMLALAAIAQGREVIVSRGELVEIGGSFRIPDVMELSRARLVEVGTTNKTRLADYERAIGPDTALLLKVHQANFAIVGFTEDASVAELATLSKSSGVPVMMDLGSGSLMSQAELSAIGLANEPSVPQVLSAGVDLVTFSGDKLLGGPQAGIIAGTKELVERARKHPLMRALRPDKLAIASLCATLEMYRDGRDDEIPTLAMLRAKSDGLRQRAEGLLDRVGDSGRLGIEVVPCSSAAGGGSEPRSALSSWGLCISGIGADDIAAALRRWTPPIIGRIKDDQVILDVRCLFDTDLEVVAAALRGIGDPHGG